MGEKMSWSDAIGTIGTILLILAYFLLQAGKLKGDDWVYMIMNLVAAALLLYSLYFNFNLPSFIIELFWVGISGYGIWRKLQAKKGLI
jgi:hypothetical protein